MDFLKIFIYFSLSFINNEITGFRISFRNNQIRGPKIKSRATIGHTLGGSIERQLITGP